MGGPVTEEDLMRGRHLMTDQYTEPEYVAEIDNDIKVAQQAAQELADAGQFGPAAMMRAAADRHLDERNRFTR